MRMPRRKIGAARLRRAPFECHEHSVSGYKSLNLSRAQREFGLLLGARKRPLLKMDLLIRPFLRASLAIVLRTDEKVKTKVRTSSLRQRAGVNALTSAPSIQATLGVVRQTTIHKSYAIQVPRFSSFVFVHALCIEHD